jgi:uncharacterized protein with HEPN domain
MAYWRMCRSKHSKTTGSGGGSSNVVLRLFPKPVAHLPDDLKARNPEIPWQKAAGIGNILRHNYESIAAAVLWKLVQADLPTLEKACRSELATEQGRERR